MVIVSGLVVDWIFFDGLLIKWARVLCFVFMRLLYYKFNEIQIKLFFYDFSYNKIYIRYRKFQI
mgnify:CR=1 FL=1